MESRWKTLPEKIQVDARKANYEKIWNYAKNLSEEDYKTFATSPELMSYDYMKEFKNRDSRLYVTLMFPFKGWHEQLWESFIISGILM